MTRTELDFLKAKVNGTQLDAEALQNAYDAVFDGVKYIADEDKPFAFVAPMMCKANMFYEVSKVENDGIKDVVSTKKYVCIKDGIVGEDNFAEHMVEW